MWFWYYVVLKDLPAMTLYFLLQTQPEAELQEQQVWVRRTEETLKVQHGEELGQHVWLQCEGEQHATGQREEDTRRTLSFMFLPLLVSHISDNPVRLSGLFTAKILYVTVRCSCVLDACSVLCWKCLPGLEFVGAGSRSAQCCHEPDCLLLLIRVLICCYDHFTCTLTIIIV